MEKLTDAIGIVLFESEKFGGEKVLKGGICPTLRANKTSSGVIEVMADVKIIGQMDNTIVAMRGRNPDNPSGRTAGSPTEQRLEMNMQGTSNCLTSVQKDNLVMENLIIGGEQKHQSVKKDGICTCLTSSMGTGGGYVPMIAPQYRIRKLTPRECWRLMDFSDEDFEKAAEVNSNTQLYKQAGNSIICNVLVAILGQLIEGKEDAYRKV